MDEKRLKMVEMKAKRVAAAVEAAESKKVKQSRQAEERAQTATEEACIMVVKLRGHYRRSRNQHRQQLNTPPTA